MIKHLGSGPTTQRIVEIYDKLCPSEFAAESLDTKGYDQMAVLIDRATRSTAVCSRNDFKTSAVSSKHFPKLKVTT